MFFSKLAFSVSYRIVITLRSLGVISDVPWVRFENRFIYCPKINKMEVILKKTKITTSVLAQSRTSQISDLKNGVILGFCFYKTKAFIITYNKEVGLITKIRVFHKVETKEQFRDEKTVFVLKIHYDDTFYYFCFDTEEESIEAVLTLEKTKEALKAKGQFYI